MRFVLGVLGMPGSGKSQVAELFRNCGLPIIRLGGFIEEEVVRRGLPLNSANETLVRNGLREEFGKGVLASRVLDAISVDTSESLFVLDGVASPEEDHALRMNLEDSYFTIAILVDRDIRYSRLEVRDHRHLTNEQAEERDLQEIRSLRKAECMVLSDYFVLNNDDLHSLLQLSLTKVVDHVSKSADNHELDWYYLNRSQLFERLDYGARIDAKSVWLLIALAQIENDPMMTWHACKAIGDYDFEAGKTFLLSVGAKPDIELEPSSLHRIAARSLARLSSEPFEVLAMLHSKEPEQDVLQLTLWVNWRVSRLSTKYWRCTSLSRTMRLSCGLG